jgi:hypothetical protein
MATCAKANAVAAVIFTEVGLYGERAMYALDEKIAEIAENCYT